MKQAGKIQKEKDWKNIEEMGAWQINREGFVFFHKLCPNYVLAEFLNCIFAGISPYFNIYMAAEIVDRLSKGAGSAVYPVVVFTVAGNFIIGILQWILKEACRIKGRIFSEEFDRRMVVKVQSMDYQDIENPEVQQLRKKMLEDMRMGGRGTGMFLNSICCIANALSSVLMAAGFFLELVVLLFYASSPLAGVAFLLVLCVLLILNIAASLKYQKTESKLAEKNGVMLSEENTMEDALDCSHSGKDIRIYRQDGLILPLKKRYLIDIHWEVFSGFFQKIFRYETVPTALQYLMDIFIYAVVCIYALLGVLGVGSIIKYIGFMKRMTDSLMWLVRNITALKFNTPFLAQFFKFFYYPSVMHNGMLPVEGEGYEIEFCNVSFRYPGSDAYALKNVSLTVREGERTAIVGRNGSGKTTLIKLLCRLYDPTEGVIRLNGKDIREYQYDEYIRLFSAVFQDYKLFSFSILENITLSEEADRQKAIKCLEFSGFGKRLSELQKGLDTVLYKDFEEDGIEISGGEAQKIAVARAVYQDASFVLLDEPTAALDPISEHELYQKFDEISKGKTVVYISHRLSSCCFCNRILVLKDGELASEGTHEELLEESGEYAKLWGAQAQYYAEERINGFLEK